MKRQPSGAPITAELAAMLQLAAELARTDRATALRIRDLVDRIKARLPGSPYQRLSDLAAEFRGSGDEEADLALGIVLTGLSGAYAIGDAEALAELAQVAGHHMTSTVEMLGVGDA